MAFEKIPSGIKTLDANIDDGFPAGSVILLLEDVGAGAREFVYTSVMNIIRLKGESRYFEIMNKKHRERKDEDEIETTLVLPDKIYYISFSRSREDILKENAYGFDRHFYENLEKGVIFKELSALYFRRSIAQQLLFSDNNKNLEFDLCSEQNILETISELFDTSAANNIVILDSLTELILCEDDYLQKDDIIMFLKGLVHISKTWNGLIYLILSTRILEGYLQEIIADLVDGVLTFEWDKKSVRMQRSLYITKFRGLLPKLESNNIEKFETRITSDDGFEVSNIRKII